ncbi:MAG TPA: hypothetical protein V6D48_26605 [Oculatellaceae cyanobacterium]
MANSSFATSSQRSSKTYRLLISGTLAMILLCIILGVISSSSPTTVWDGAFPAGEFHLKIRNENGDPIPGAALNVLDRSTKNLSFYYPIDNYVSYNSLSSDEQGMITAVHLFDGFEFGGSCWELFWIYPMCSGAPEYDFAISADGYETLWLGTDEFFAPAHNQMEIGTSSVVEHGEVVELPVYELLFVLGQ